MQASQLAPLVNILFTDKNYSLNPEMTAGLKGYFSLFYGIP